MNSGYAVVALVILFFACVFGLTQPGDDVKFFSAIGIVGCIFGGPFLLINDGATWT